MDNGQDNDNRENIINSINLDALKPWDLANQADDLLKLILDQIPAGIIILDANEIVSIVNQKAMDFFDQQFIIGEKLAFGLFKMDRTPYLYEERPPIRTLRTGKAIEGEDAIFIDQKGNEYIYMISSRPIYNSGEIVAVVVALQDVTIKIRVVEALSDSEDRFRSMFENAATGMAVLTLDGYFVMTNKALCNILGYSGEDFSEATFLDHIWKNGRNEVLRRYEQLIRGEMTHFQMEQKLIHKDGKIIWGLISFALVRNTTGNPFYLIGQVQDITKLKKIEEDLRVAKNKAELLANTDYLTGILNRRAFIDRLMKRLTKSPKKSIPISLIMTDIDFFKKVNDTHGHAVGDIVLKKYANCLVGLCKVPCFIGRYGGEEFVIGSPNTSLEQAGIIAEKIRAAVEELKIKSSDGLQDIRITSSFGVAVADRSGVSTDDLIVRADQALYQAKIQGRNQVCLEEERSR